MIKLRRKLSELKSTQAKNSKNKRRKIFLSNLGEGGGGGGKESTIGHYNLLLIARSLVFNKRLL